jgi:hypothetical protein
MHADVARQIFETRRQVEQIPDFFLVFDARLQLRLGGNRLGQRQRLVGLDRNQLGQLVAEVVRQVEHAPDVANDRLRRHGAEGDDLRHGRRPVLLAHVLDHPPAIVLAEVDVEVGHRHPLGVQEALEEQRVAQRVEVGDAESIGDDGTGARAASGTDRTAVVLGPVDEVGNDQEVARKPHLHDGIGFELQARVVGRTLRRRSAGSGKSCCRRTSGRLPPRWRRKSSSVTPGGVGKSGR